LPREIALKSDGVKDAADLPGSLPPKTRERLVLHHRPLARSILPVTDSAVTTTHQDNAMKTYTGTRTEDGCAVVVSDGERSRALDPRFDLRNHSPTGFEWGYGGSGPAQLALALAADVLADDEAALEIYQRLKFRVVGGLPHGGWTLTEEELAEAIQSLRRSADE
jgi:hypothetical protein